MNTKYIWVVIHCGSGREYFYNRRPLKTDLIELRTKEEPNSSPDNLSETFSVRKEKLRG
jgi:hypothetical protein